MFAVFTTWLLTCYSASVLESLYNPYWQSADNRKNNMCVNDVELCELASVPPFEAFVESWLNTLSETIDIVTLVET